MTRHQMRQSAVMLTFERLFNDDSIESILETAKECETVPVDDKVIALFRGVDARRDVLDPPPDLQGFPGGAPGGHV